MHIRKTVKILCRLAAVVVILVVATLIAVQSPKVQTYLAGKALTAIGNQIDGTISIGRIHIDPFKAVVIKDLAVIDPAPFRDSSGRKSVDTLFRAGYVTATFSIRSLLSGGSLHLSSAKVTDGVFALAIEPSDRSRAGDTTSTTNLKRIFRLGKSGKEKSKSDKDVFTIGDVELSGMSFKMVNFQKDASKFGDEDINWFDLYVSDINLKGRKMKMKGPVMSGICDKMSFREKSGYACYLLSGRTRVGDGKTVVEDLKLIDGWSNVDIPKFVMTYKDTDAWSDFISAVRMTANIDKSTVSMHTLGYFAPALKNFHMTARVKGNVDGYVNDLHLKGMQFITSDADGFVDWDRAGGNGISGELSGSIIGLPDSQAMLTEADVKRISFTSAGLEHFIKGWARNASLDIGKICKGETMTFTGKARGPLNRMAIQGTLHSPAGKVKANATIHNVIDSRRPLQIGGIIETDELDVGKVIGDIPVGKLDMHAGLSAVLDKDSLGVRIDSLKIDRLNVLGYDYTGIAAAGTYGQEAFNGRIVCSDPNLNFLFQGIFTLSSKTQNALYQFYANIGYADLQALNIDKRGTSKVSLTTMANFTRVSGEDILGNIDIDNVVLEDSHGVHNIGDIKISSHAGNGINRVRLTSGFAEGSFSGSKFFASFIRDLQTVTTRRELPSLYTDAAEPWNGNRYDMSFKLHDTKDILSFFAPGVYIADSTALTLSIDRNGGMQASLKSGRLAYRDKYIRGISLDIGNSGGVIDAQMYADEIKVAPVLARSGRIRFLANDDNIGAGFSYDNATELENRGEIMLDGKIYRDENDSLAIRAGFRHSYIYLKSNLWKIASSGIDIHKGRASIDSLALDGDGQSILIRGGYSASKADTLHLSMDKFDISLANSFTNMDMGIRGRMTGHAMLISPVSSRAGILMNIACDSTAFGGHDAGTVRIAGVWDEEKEGFNYVCRNTIGGVQTFGATGNFYPRTKELEGKLSLSGFDAGYAEPFLSSVFSSVSGSISGDIAFIGPVKELSLASKGLRLDRTRLKVGFTNVEYTADGPVSLDSTEARFENVDVTDRFGEKGVISGNIGWNHLKDIHFGTDIRFTRMEVLNLGETDNPVFYGNIFATGDVSISGPMNAITLTADAQTAKRGDIHIPLNSSSSAGQSNLLTFKEPYKEVVIDPYEELMKRLKEKETRGNDFGIRLRVNATPDVSANIEIDKDAGNVLTGYGNGLIDLEIRPGTGLFSINGNYNITSGIYHFVALGIAKRDFTIQDGSSVRFNGDVMDSDLDINALYKTKASVGTLIADTTSTARRTVECGIAITDKLSNPRLAFTIDIPDLDPTTQSRVEGALNTQDKVQKQLLALLISNSFLPDEQSGVTNTSSSMLFSNVSEIMAGQLNNILQKLNIPVDFGLDYQQNSSGSDIFDVALSTALFNNRVIVNGTIGNRQYNSSGTSSGSEVVGDLDIDVKLDKPGALRLNLFSHSADQYANYLDNSQRNGVGLTYQKEFDRFGEFVRNLFRSRRRKQEIEAARQQELQNERKVKIKIEAEEPDKRKSDGKRK